MIYLEFHRFYMDIGGRALVQFPGNRKTNISASIMIIRPANVNGAGKCDNFPIIMCLYRM